MGEVPDGDDAPTNPGSAPDPQDRNGLIQIEMLCLYGVRQGGLDDVLELGYRRDRLQVSKQ